MGGYYCYVLQSEKDGKYYVGHTRDLTDRLRRHNKGRVTSTKGRGPWTLVHSERFPTRTEAAQRERAIKNRKSKTFLQRVAG